MCLVYLSRVGCHICNVILRRRMNIVNILDTLAVNFRFRVSISSYVAPQ